jgi:hypothetical protein
MTKAEENKIIEEVINKNLQNLNLRFRKYESWQVELKAFHYANNDNIGLQLYIEDEPYATVSVNIERLPAYEFCVDVNNFPAGMELLYINHIACPAKRKNLLRSGFCVYPVWVLEGSLLDGVQEALEGVK